MTRTIASLALLVPSYDDGIAFYVGKLGFVLVEDTPLSPTKRWVRVAPSEAAETSILLAQAANARQERAIGDQCGGRVFLFLETDDFDRDHAAFLAQGVQFVETPRDEDYGRVAVFEDPWGNRWDLIEPAR